MLANALRNGRHAGITDTETLSCHTCDVCLTGGRAIKGNVTDDNVFGRIIFRVLRYLYDQLTAGKTLAKIIIAVTGQSQGKTLRQECTKALSARAFTIDHDRVLRKSFRMLSRDLCAKQRTKGSVDIRDLEGQFAGRSLLQGRLNCL